MDAQPDDNQRLFLPQGRGSNVSLLNEIVIRTNRLCGSNDKNVWSEDELRNVHELTSSLRQLRSMLEDGPEKAHSLSNAQLQLVPIPIIAILRSTSKTEWRSTSQQMPGIFQPLLASSCQCLNAYADKLREEKWEEKMLHDFLVTVSLNFPCDQAHIEELFSALDSGSECATALLRTASCLCAMLGDAFFSTSKTPVLFRLIDGTCLILTCFSNALGKMQRVCMDSILFLEMLMKIVDNKATWQLVFPGVFTAIFRFILQANKERSTSSLLLVQRRSLQLLVRLFQSSIDEDSSHLHSLSHADILQRMRRSGTCITLDSEGFIAKVNKSAIVPLKRVMSLALGSKETGLQLEGLALCRMVFMYASRSMWTDKSLERDSALLLLSLVGSNCESLSRGAAHILSEHVVGLTEQIVSLVLLTLSELRIFLESGHTSRTSANFDVACGSFRFIQNELLSIPFHSETEILKSIMDLASFCVVGLDEPSISIAARATEPMDISSEGANSLRLHELFRAFGSVLGVRKAVAIVDSLVADASECSFEILPIKKLIAANEILRGAISLHDDRQRSSGPGAVLRSLGILIAGSLERFDVVEVEDSHPSTTAERSVVVLVALLNTIFEFLEEDCRLLIADVVYPLLKLAVHEHIVAIKQVSEGALGNLANQLSHGSMDELVAASRDVLLSETLTRLRTTGFRHDEKSLEILLSISSVFTSILKAGRPSSHATSSTCSEVVTTALEWFDVFDTCGYTSMMSRESWLCFLDQVEGIEQFLRLSWGVKLDFMYTYSDRFSSSGLFGAPNGREKLQWVKYLGGFCNERSDNERTGREVTFSPDKRLPWLKREFASNDIALISLTISRCSYVFSYQDLTIQKACCAVMALGFKLLGFISCAHVTPSDRCDESEDHVRSAVLRQVAEVWPPLRARMVQISRHLASQNPPQSNQWLALDRNVSGRSFQEAAHCSRCLASLLDLVSSLVQTAGGFMASRIRQDVLPILSAQLARFVERQPAHFRGDSCDFQDSDKALLLSSIRCCESIFGQTDCGVALQDLVSSYGTLLLAFLVDEEQQICGSAMEALKKLLAIDSDCLLRPLYRLSGKPLPQNCLMPAQLARNKEVTSTSNPNLGVQQLACELLDFISQLPEGEFQL